MRIFLVQFTAIIIALALSRSGMAQSIYVYNATGVPITVSICDSVKQRIEASTKKNDWAPVKATHSYQVDWESDGDSLRLRTGNYRAIIKVVTNPGIKDKEATYILWGYRGRNFTQGLEQLDGGGAIILSYGSVEANKGWDSNRYGSGLALNGQLVGEFINRRPSRNNNLIIYPAGKVK